MSDIPIMKSDKLREAMRVVWLANKYNEELSTSEIARISGYSSSGIWSAIEHGWFKEDPEDNMIKLTEKGELYLKNKLLNSFEIMRMLVALLTYFIGFLAMQDILLDYFNISLHYEWSTLFPSVLLLILFYIFFYRIVWYFRKRKK